MENSEDKDKIEYSAPPEIYQQQQQQPQIIQQQPQSYQMSAMYQYQQPNFYQYHGYDQMTAPHAQNQYNPLILQQQYPLTQQQQYNPYLQWMQQNTTNQVPVTVVNNGKKRRAIQIPGRCDQCGIDFDNQAQLSNHQKQHVPCDYPGCLFQASKKIVNQHKSQVHELKSEQTNKRKANDMIVEDDDSGGIKVKIMQDAEIEQWRAERRSNYPTAENILRKQNVAQEKREQCEDVLNKALSRFRQDVDDQSHDKKNKNKKQKLQKTEKKKSNQICRNFQLKGKCNFGEKCRHIHVKEDTTSKSDIQFVLESLLFLMQLEEQNMKISQLKNEDQLKQLVESISTDLKDQNDESRSSDSNQNASDTEEGEIE